MPSCLSTVARAQKVALDGGTLAHAQALSLARMYSTQILEMKIGNMLLLA
jgi:hypothetical protein